jgi:hypothetical protein
MKLLGGTLQVYGNVSQTTENGGVYIASFSGFAPVALIEVIVARIMLRRADAAYGGLIKARALVS